MSLLVAEDSTLRPTSVGAKYKLEHVCMLTEYFLDRIAGQNHLYTKYEAVGYLCHAWGRVTCSIISHWKIHAKEKKDCFPLTQLIVSAVI